MKTIKCYSKDTFRRLLRDEGGWTGGGKGGGANLAKIGEIGGAVLATVLTAGAAAPAIAGLFAPATVAGTTGAGLATAVGGGLAGSGGLAAGLGSGVGGTVAGGTVAEGTVAGEEAGTGLVGPHAGLAGGGLPEGGGTTPSFSTANSFAKPVSSGFGLQQAGAGQNQLEAHPFQSGAKLATIIKSLPKSQTSSQSAQPSQESGSSSQPSLATTNQGLSPQTLSQIRTMLASKPASGQIQPTSGGIPITAPHHINEQDIYPGGIV
jgi:hypothetical protein